MPITDNSKLFDVSPIPESGCTDSPVDFDFGSTAKVDADNESRPLPAAADLLDEGSGDPLRASLEADDAATIWPSLDNRPAPADPDRERISRAILD